MKVIIAIFLLVTLALTLSIPKVNKNLKPNPTTYSFIVVMKESLNMQQVLKQKSGNMTRSQLGYFVFEGLRAFSQKSQGSIKLHLDKLNVKHTSYWINNVIYVENASEEQLRAIAARDDVLEIKENIKATVNPIDVQKEVKKNTLAVQENIQYIHAPEAWAKGFDGSGVVIAVLDTGLQFNHIALDNNYRGKKSDGTYDHNYSWFDAVKTGSGSSCGYNLRVPCDDHGHGTHCTGTACGYGQGIGVAPKAKTVHCRMMSRGSGTLNQILACLQWVVAPTDLDGNNPKPDMRPDVSSNSYGFQGDAGPDFKRAADNVKASGVAFVAAAGNSGNSCGTIRGDPAKLQSAFTVGALDRNSQNIVYFSSVGKTPDGRTKPNIMAPGTSIYSSIPNNRFTRMSGTSMATPTVAGHYALIKTQGKKFEKLSVDETQKMIEQTAIARSASVCGTSGVPNAYYGWGNIDCKKSVDQ